MKCIICNYEIVNYEDLRHIDSFEIKCQRCGTYRFVRSAEGRLSNLKDKEKKILCIIIRNNEIRGGELYFFNTENIKELVDNYIELTVPEKIDKLQINLARLVNKPNGEIKINETLDWPLAYAEDQTEITYYLEYLQENGLIRISNRGSGNFILNITVPGWSSISELQKKIPTSNKAFVAMNFDKDFNDLYENSIKTAIEDNGYTSIISNRTEHVNLIDDFIMAEIKESRFVVAEFTGQKHGVYFEAGYARGLGIPVIWVCRKDDIKNLHFDTSHYNQIDWKTPEELQKRLGDRIRAVI